MIGFEYYSPAKVASGEDSEQQLIALLKESKMNSLLLVYSSDFIKDLGTYVVIEKVVKGLGIAFGEGGNVVSNPEADLVRQLVEQGEKDKVDLVLVVGGGSPIDTAKAVTLGIPYDGDVWDFFDKGISPKEVLNISVIAATASSGSETSNASITSNEEWRLGFEGDCIIPEFTIMNPKYTADLPPYQAAVGVADVLAYLLERYFSDAQHSDVTGYLTEGGIRVLLLNADRLLDDLSDINARAGIQWLASVTHNNFLGAGRNADWGSHRIEHELSAQYHIVHNEGMAVMLLAWIRYMAERKPRRPALLASRVFSVDAHDYDEKERVLILAEKLEAFFKSLELKTTLTELGIDDKDFEIMTKRTARNGSVGHYGLLDADSIREILKLAL